MPQSTASHNEKKHVRQNTRIVPVIPKHFTRKSVDKSQKKVQDGADRKTASPVHAEKELSARHKTDSPNSIRELVANGGSTSPTSAGSEDASATDPVVADSSATSATSSEHKDLLASAAPEKAVPTTRKSDDAQPVAAVAADTASEANLSDRRSAATKSPVELPPPFYPASQTALRGRDAPQRQSFIFGGAIDSSAQSPVPPPSAGSWNSSSAGLPLTDGMVSPPPPQVNGYGRPAPQMNGTRPSTANLSLANHYPQGQQPLANGHPAHPPRPWQTPQHMQPQRSTSMSSNPSEALFPQYPTYPAGPTFPFYSPADGPVGAMNMPRNMQYPSFPPSFHSTQPSGQFDPRMSPRFAPDYYNPQSLRDHVETMFDNSEYADCVLRVRFDAKATKDVSGHAVILSRSPKLRRVLAHSTATEFAAHEERSRRIIEIPSEVFFHDSSMFSTAIHYLYGGSLLRREHLQNTWPPAQAMAAILSYACVGWYLEIPEIAMAGLSLAADYLMPENLEVALEFALKHESLSHKQPGTTNGHAMFSPHTPNDHPNPSNFIYSIQNFLTFPLTNGFDLDSTAPELDTLPRIPPALRPRMGPFAHGSRHSISNPKLQAMTLGSFQAQTSGTRALSSVLLSLPSFVLQGLFADRAFRSRMPPDAAVGLVKAVVAEREKRRRAAVEAYDALGTEKREEMAEARRALVEEEVEVLPVEQGVFRLVVRDGEGTAGD